MFNCFVLVNRFYLNIPGDAQLASMSILRHSRWQPRWPPKQKMSLMQNDKSQYAYMSTTSK